jgi:hypothetical protein
MGLKPINRQTVCKPALNLAEQVVAIIAMRSIGLFYRHTAVTLVTEHDFFTRFPRNVQFADGFSFASQEARMSN